MRSRRLARHGVALVATVMVLWIADEVGFWELRRGTSLDAVLEHGIRLLQALVPLAAVALFAARAPLKIAPRRLAVGLGACLLAAAAVTACVFVTVDGYRSSAALVTATAVGGMLAGAVVLWIASVALTRWFRVACPELSAWLDRMKFVGRRAFWIRAAVVATLTGLAVLDAYRSWHGEAHHEGFDRALASQAPFLPGRWLALTLTVLSLIVAVALAHVLWSRGKQEQGPRVGLSGWRRIVTVLIAGYGVGLAGAIDNYPAALPFAFALILTPLGLRWVMHGAKAVPDTAPADHADLLRRAAQLESVTRKEATVYDSYMGGELSDDEYYKQQADLGDERTTLEGSEGGAGVRLALALGPEPAWWQNARRAARTGAYVAIVPMLYALFVVLTNDVPDDVKSVNMTAFAWIVVSLAQQVFFWVGMAALLGALYPVLPGRTAMLKALSLTLAYLAPNLLANFLLDRAEGPGWLFTAAELGLFLLIVGARLDLATLRSGRIYWRHIQDFYRLRSAKEMAAWAVPVVVLLGTVFQQLATGDSKSAIGQLIQEAPKLLSGGG